MSKFHTQRPIYLLTKFALTTALCSVSAIAAAEPAWRMDARGAAGPVAMVELPPQKGANRVAMLTFEYERRCDPLLTYATMKGRKFGAPEKQGRLPDSRLAGAVNGKKFSGPGAFTLYSNGLEIGLGVPNEMALIVLDEEVTSLSFTTPTGEEVPLPTRGLRKSADAAFKVCAQKVAP